MEFQIKERKHHNARKYNPDDFEIARKFSDRIHAELKDFLKAVVLFGSAARQSPAGFERDIDILLVVNDLTRIMSPEVVEAYRIITHRVASNTSRRLHITTLKMTAFWEYIKNGDPIAVNILRDGVPIYDTGFFEPVQVLLHQGRIRPTEESIWTYWTRAPATLLNSKWHVLQATLDLYWAVIDSAHAALMRMGEVPPSPAHVSDMISKVLVSRRLVPSRCAKTMEFFYDLSKKITHRQLQSVSGKQFDFYYHEATEFCNQMEKVIQRKDLK